MDLLPSEDQQDIADASAEVLTRQLPPAGIRERRGEPSAISEKAWLACAEQGLLGLGLPESVGGADCGLAEEVLLFREIGRRVAPGPFLSTVLAGHLALAAGRTELAGRIAAGEVLVGLVEALPALGGPDGVGELDGPGGLGATGLSGPVRVRDWVGAEYLLALSPEGAGLVETAALTDVAAQTPFDPGTRVGSAAAADLPWGLWLPAESVSTAGSVSTADAVSAADAGDAAERVPLYVRGLLLVAAQLVGIAEAVRDSSVEYAKTREQFGRPIGVHQAIKHRCADMAVAAERAWAQLLLATPVVSGSRPDTEFQAHTAKVVASTAARESAAANIQIHGGMGYTAEFDGHLFVTRAEVLELTLASREESLAAILALPVPQ